MASITTSIVQTSLFSTHSWVLYLLIGLVIGLSIIIIVLITGRRFRADRRVLEERNQLRTLIDSLPDYLYIKDKKSRFIIANRSVAYNMNCNHPSQLIGKTDFDFYQKDLAEGFYADEQHVMVTNKPMINKIEPAVNRHGKRIYISSTKLPLHDSKGRVIGLVGVGRDITTEKMIELEVLSKNEVILKERNQLRTLIDNIPDCIYIKDTNGRILVANRRMAEVVGFDSPEELIMKTDSQLFPMDLANRYANLEKEVIHKGVVKTSEEPIITSKGVSIFGSITLIPLRNSEKEITGIIGIRRDISDLKRVEYLKELNQQMREKQEEILKQSEELNAQKEQLERSNSKLQTLNSTKDRFFSIIAHDLKNPFFAITSLAEIIINEYNEMPDDEKIQLVQLIKLSAQKTFSLFENLLHWARTQTNQIRFNPQIFDIRTLIEENIKFIEITADGKNITIKNSITTCYPILADKDMVNLVLRNLLSNAIKFTINGGSITLHCENISDKFIKISVEDNGVGMDDETINKLFKIDHHVSTTGTAGETGTGLGLIVCKEFIEMNGGEISIVSKPNKGSSFSFTVPKASVS